MNNQSSTIVQRLWNYCNVLRDDGMSYGDYVEQLTYLLFLKMDHENSSMLGKASAIPAEFNWAGLLRCMGSSWGEKKEEGRHARPAPTIIYSNFSICRMSARQAANISSMISGATR